MKISLFLNKKKLSPLVAASFVHVTLIVIIQIENKVKEQKTLIPENVDPK
jgi:hypothetical protein